MKRWQLISLSLCLIITPAVFVLHYWMNTTATGTVRTTVPTQTSAAHSSLLVTTSFFSASLPDGFTVKNQTENTTDPLVQLRLVADTNTVTDQQFAATLGTMPTAGLPAISDYHLRTSDTATYKQVTLPRLPAGTTAFQTVSAPTSLVVFWPHGSHYLELAFSTSGGASLTQLQATYLQVMQDWQWRS